MMSISKIPNIVKIGYVIMIDTLCQGETVSVWEEIEGKDSPCVFETKELAYKEIADSMITVLQQFIDGERGLDETDFGTEEYVEEYVE